MRARALAASTSTVLLSEGFSASATTNSWTRFGAACLTAGTAKTPATSLPACGANAPLDATGQGALQLTAGAGSQAGMVISQTPLATANGLQVTFTDYAFHGTTPGADGLAFFFTDASQPLPTRTGQAGSSLGYAGNAANPGLPNAYVGVGLDEYGGFSNPTGANTGGPGAIAETIAVRGAASTLWTYLGGATNAAGKAASLPFAFDQPTVAVRPANAPTIRATLTSGGILSVAIDRHDGNGFVAYYTQTIVGIAGEPAVPARVYFGVSAGTGGLYNAHQISGLVVSAIAPAAVGAGSTLKTEAFTGAATSPNVWSAKRSGPGDVCLTAGTAATTPATSLPACGASAPQDPAGAGALQITSGTGSQSGMVVSGTALPTANGLQITFTDYAFNGTTPGADGMTFFLTDASKPLPTNAGSPGGGLGYAGAAGGTGLANAYVGVALDEFGGFSSPSGGHTGGPGQVAETISVRGAAATNWQYLGGVTNAAGKAVSLPFSLDQPKLTTRPTNAPTVRATLTAAGNLSVALDHHDGAGFVAYYTQSIVGVNGQPAVPAQVYFGFTAGTGGLWNRHQISGLVITTASGTLPLTAGNPPQIVSTNGSLVFNVSAQADKTTGNPEFLYNGSTVPPTLRLLPGDTLVVNMTNNLPVPPAGSGYANTTNLHYHGLHVSPQSPGDDSIDMLASPGQSLHYSLQIPLNHPPGLYWYHTHSHAETERQTLAGMSGALIIDGVAAYTPQISNMVERVLVVRDAPTAGSVLPNASIAQLYSMRWAMQHGVVMHAAPRGAASSAMPGMAMPGTTTPAVTPVVRASASANLRTTGTSADRSEFHAASTSLTRNPFIFTNSRYKRYVRPLATSTHCVAAESPSKTLTVNGQTQPVLAILPGEQQFWRLVNAGADTYLDVQVDNTQMQIVSLDGVPLISGVGTPASMTVTHWVLPPASRVEFIVKGPAAGATAYLRTNCFDAGSAGAAMPAQILASISPTASTPAVRSASQVAKRVAVRAQRFAFHTAGRIRATAVAATRTIYYSDQNNINGVTYDPAAPPQFYAQSGTVEEWTIQNNSSQVHTFHIHQVHFVVEAINGTTQAQQYVMDNVNVPAATANGPGTVKVLLDFTDPTIIGTFLLHCHILSHEDAGMMAKIRIGTAPPLAVSAPNVTFASATSALSTVSISGGQAPFSVTGCAGVANAAVNGANVSIAPTAAGACVLTIADASTPSITATVSVQVNAGAAVVTLAPNSTSFASPTAAAQSVAITGGTAPFTASGCANIATAAINGAVVRISPLAAGACSITISDAAGNSAVLSVSVNAPVVSNLLDNVTFHQNSQRTGWYPNETALNTTTVASANFGQIATLTAPAGMTAMGKVYAQPLYVTNESAIDGKTHNLVIVASANDQVYAFDEVTHAVVWHRDFTNVAGGIRQQLNTDIGCDDVSPDAGIIGTPVIDRTRDAIYVVVATMESGVAHTRLHAIGLGNGNDLIAPTSITGALTMATGGTATISSLGNMNRAALLEANGNIYVALGSHCDSNASAIHGWVLSYSASTLAETGSLVDLSNANDGSGFYLGSVWMSGFGPAADAAGNIYFATGNGPFNGTTNFAMSFLKVPGNLNLGGATYFTPASEAADSAADEDLGSAGVMLLPDQPGATPHLLVGGGKCSVGNVGCLKFIINRDNLGGQQANNAGALWQGRIAATMFGGPAYFADANGGQHVIYGTGTPLATYTLGLSPVQLTVQSSANPGCLECRDSGSQPIVSSNGTQAGTAVVWALKTPGASGGPISLYAFNALQMSSTLFVGSAGVWSRPASITALGGALISPTVANGRVYVPSDGAVTVFGLH